MTWTGFTRVWDLLQGPTNIQTHPVFTEEPTAHQHSSIQRQCSADPTKIIPSQDVCKILLQLIRGLCDDVVWCDGVVHSFTLDHIWNIHNMPSFISDYTMPETLGWSSELYGTPGTWYGHDLICVSRYLRISLWEWGNGNITRNTIHMEN